MRFFSGIRSDKKKHSASAMYKQAQANKGKPQVEKTANEKYQDMIDAKVAKMTEDAMMGRKKGSFKMPGTKQDDKPKELSKNAKLMLKLLAMQKANKDAKKEKKKLRELVWAEKSKKKAEDLAKSTAAAQIENEKRAAEEAAAAASAAPSQSWSYGSTYSNDDKGGGWW